MNIIDTIVTFVRDGGVWMYPILTVGAIGAAIVVERFIKLFTVRNANRRMWDKLHPVLAAGDFDQARELTANDKSTISELEERTVEVRSRVICQR